MTVYKNADDLIDPRTLEEMIQDGHETLEWVRKKLDLDNVKSVSIEGILAPYASIEMDSVEIVQAVRNGEL